MIFISIATWGPPCLLTHGKWRPGSQGVNEILVRAFAIYSPKIFFTARSLPLPEPSRHPYHVIQFQGYVLLAMSIDRLDLQEDRTKSDKQS